LNQDFEPRLWTKTLNQDFEPRLWTKKLLSEWMGNYQSQELLEELWDRDVLTVRGGDDEESNGVYIKDAIQIRRFLLIDVG